MTSPAIVREALERIADWCCPVLCTNCAENRQTALAALAALDATPGEGVMEGLVERANGLIEARQMAANDAAHAVVYVCMATLLSQIVASLPAAPLSGSEVR